MDYTSAAATDEALLAEDRSFFAWIISIFTLSDDKFLQKCGSDAVQYLRFQRHLITFTFVIMVVCIGVILPINFQVVITYQAVKNYFSGIKINPYFLFLGHIAR